MLAKWAHQSTERRSMDCLRGACACILDRPLARERKTFFAEKIDLIVLAAQDGAELGQKCRCSFLQEWAV
ncbi:hypothetical protein APZ15_05620 [Burkholderia cepacia ATCC 25416]|nr:hypothetical protein APZ15_05620 [Burkholderia cepacia ATCC 25416]